MNVVVDTSKGIQSNTWISCLFDDTWTTFMSEVPVVSFIDKDVKWLRINVGEKKSIIIIST